MYIQEITLQGFKTYMNKTVISGFDPQFNAITGLNGSGKSNILDGIQFLLGSTSKQMLRLKTGLTQLIYKQGFAGIDRAIVSIKFRCKQKHMRPTGYQDCQELTVTRVISKDKITKLYINGTTSNLTKVKNLFRSVQLNIQNPHFLVKQGQITKIINLKPLELLGMIEQTAGTAFYNKTRTQSEKIIQRKQQKLQSIDQILTSTIKPQMQKLQSDRVRYQAFQQKQKHAQNLQSKIVKHEYGTKLMEIKNRQYRTGSLKQTFSRSQKQINQLTQRSVEIQNQIKILKTKGDNQFLKQYTNLKNLIHQQENKRKNIKNRLQVIQQQSINMKQQTTKNQQQMERLKQQIQWQQKQVIQAEKQVQESSDLLNQIAKSKNQQEAFKLIQKQIKQQQSTINNIKDQIRTLQSKKASTQRDSQNQLKSFQQAKQNMDQMTKNLKTLQEDIQKFKNIEKPRLVEDPQLGVQQLRRLQAQRRKYIQQNYKIGFSFQDPQPGFNRKLVRGKMFMIFKVKDRIHQKALQIGVGAKLYNVIVENQIASQKLLKAQSFGPVATIIPNNKVRPQFIRQQVIKNAQAIAKKKNGLAKLACQLIEYQHDLKNSIMHGFGNFIVCSSPEIAKEIALGPDRRLQCRCVTYDGDIYDSGTLTGGSDGNFQYILPKYRELRVVQEKISVLRVQYDQKNKQYEEYKNRANQYNLMQKQIENKINRRDKLSQKLASISATSKPRDYSEELSGLDKKIQSLGKQLKERENKLKQLSSKVKGGSMKSIQQQKKQILNDKQKAQKKLADAKKKISINEVQIQQIENKMKISDQTQQQQQKQIRQLQKDETQIIDKIKQNKIQFQAFQQKKMQYEKQITLNNNQIQALANQIQDIQKRKHNHIQNNKKITQDIQNIQKDIAQFQKELAKLIAENPWIQNQREIEIQPDFDYHRAVKQHTQLLIDVDKLRKTVKVNVDDHSFQKLSEQYKDLLKKKQTLQGDKVTLLNNMHELDQKRTKTLQTCFRVVKENLGTIFNDLLPGATAHLNLVDQNDVTKGAELRVHFNNVKKQLSELSGGQRSLLALSFILALLLYKPSPFYILDEIDSALDLSHTQNIGYMISKRFPQSQFLLISLKQGMFQNANVLYKVHFAEGESKVDRQVLKKKK